MLLSVVMPMYNEQEVLRETHRRLSAVCSAIEMDYELIFVDDGSRDATMEIALKLQANDPHLRILTLARNSGQQIALTAGLDVAQGDCVFIIDADLQDPPELLPQMLEKWREGYQVVYGKRAERRGESFLKKFTASMYYRVVTWLSGFPIPKDTSDFRLIDRSVVEALRAMPEHSRYLRGMIAWIGFRQTPVEFVRQERFAGETKYTLKKMLKLASDGIFSFSTRPMAFLGGIGALLGGGGALYLLGVLIAWIVSLTIGYVFADAQGHVTLALILAVGGLILLGMGLLGAYIGRIFEDVKGRPHYFIARRYGFEEKTKEENQP